MNCGPLIPQKPKSHIKLTYITHFYLDTDLSAVRSLLDYYSQMDGELLDQIQFVVVDDCSPISYSVPKTDLNLLWLRIVDPTPWNQGGARNLGVVYAKSDNIFLTDLDWKVNEEALRFMVNKRCCGRTIYKIREQGRRKGHSNTWFMSRAHFLRHFGYDEQFSGGHGGEDYFFFKLHQYSGSIIKYMPRRCFAIDRAKIGEISEANYHHLPRDQSRNEEIGRRVKENIKKFGYEGGHSRIFLNFRWEVVADQNRPLKFYKPKPNKIWRWSWYIRWLFGGC
jgi:hypothetical protein